MSTYLIKDETLVSIADPVRELGGLTNKLSPSDMSAELGTINSAVTQQAEFISLISTVLDEKTGGSGGGANIQTTSLTILSDAVYYITYLAYENGGLITRSTISMGGMGEGDVYNNIPVGAFVAINTNSTVSGITGAATNCNIVQSGLHDKAWTVQVGTGAATFTISM